MLETDLTFGSPVSAEMARRTWTAYRIERLSETEFADTLVPEWEALHGQLRPRTPFTSPEWNILWWNHFGSSGRWKRNELFAHAVRDSSDRLVAVAPMVLTSGPRLSPLKLRAARCFGTDPNITEIRSVICKPRDEVHALVQLGREFARHRHVDWIDWGTVRAANWDSLASLIPRDSIKASVPVIDYHLELPGSWAEFRHTRSRNIRESIRKCYNSLTRVGFAPELEIVSAPSECDAALRTFLKLHEQRSRARHMVRHANVFSTHRGRAFLTDYVRAMAQTGQLQIFQLRVGGSIVASRIGFVFGDSLYLYYSGYDPAWARYSVMTTVVVEAIKWAIDNGLKVINLSTGTDVSKCRWGPGATEYRGALQVGEGWRARRAYAAYHWVRSRRDRLAGCPSPEK